MSVEDLAAARRAHLVAAAVGGVEPSLRDLNPLRPLYLLPADPFAEEVLIPGFRTAEAVDCMVGFFSSAILAALAPGLASYLTNRDHKFRLVISPMLSLDDRNAIEDGLKSAEDVATGIIEPVLLTIDVLQKYTLRCLSHLLRNGQIEIKIALMEDALFHPKVWLFRRGSEVLAAHGSSNVTHAGIRKNMEQIATSKSWADTDQRFTTDKLSQEFVRLWGNRQEHCIVVALPDAVREQLIRTYANDAAPTEDDLRQLYARARDQQETVIDAIVSISVE